MSTLLAAQRQPMPVRSEQDKPLAHTAGGAGHFELRGVSKRYRSGQVEVRALHSIDLAFDGGVFLALSGPSGSGKSTLLHILGCLARPSEGSVVFDQQLVLHHVPKSLTALRREKIGFVFQSACLIPTLTVAENVEYPLSLLRMSRVKCRELVQEALADVGLEPRAQHYPDQLSGGERQRAALARALVKRPPLVVADEPTASLDSRTAMDIIALMRELNRSKGMTFVFSTHDERLLTSVNQVVNLRDGEIVHVAH
uniref:Putative ABC transport system ATP-binding protein n=1 Tax=Candidatus Kentrum sp. MB TaxID=2138164 RepID=A0A450XJX5_9GAMM|nr:MAG: putative ABC transport system ATP-binding protein [Candidatus Kentron sp. MB]VFK29630.1 MAG: putative ABC transport system ATP-binding protein [Candidatus Kentron sp. MB]VFK74845.1 MAG: putative ABC transport system ATP-binding protein [Candidatus Kentron sp. MB]